MEPWDSKSTRKYGQYGIYWNLDKSRNLDRCSMLQYATSGWRRHYVSIRWDAPWPALHDASMRKRAYEPYSTGGTVDDPRFKSVLFALQVNDASQNTIWRLTAENKPKNCKETSSGGSVNNSLKGETATATSCTQADVWPIKQAWLLLARVRSKNQHVLTKVTDSLGSFSGITCASFW